MKTVTEWIRGHLLRSCGMNYVTIDEVNVAASRSAAFDSMCETRLKMGFIRYESILGRDQFPGYLQRAYIALECYEKTRNLDYLADARNYVDREYQSPSFEGAFFEGTDHPELP